MTHKELIQGIDILNTFLNMNESSYSLSWEKIMAVFQKIQKLGYGFAIMHDEVEIFESGYQCVTHSIKKTNENTTLIETVFDCCVDFIIQYNAGTLKQLTK